MASLNINTSELSNSYAKPEGLLLKPKQDSNTKPELGSNVHSIQFSDPLVRDEKNKEVVYIGEDTSGEETGGGETTETESKHSDEEDWHNDPPDDYLEHVEVCSTADFYFFIQFEWWPYICWSMLPIKMKGTIPGLIGSNHRGMRWLDMTL